MVQKIKKDWHYILGLILGILIGVALWKAGYDALLQTVVLTGGAGFGAVVLWKNYKDSRKAYNGERREVYVGLEVNRDVAAAVKEYFGRELDYYLSANAEFGTFELSEMQMKRITVKFLKGLDRYQNCKIHLFYQGPLPILANIFRYQGLNFEVALHCYDTVAKGFKEFDLVNRAWMQ